MVVGDPPAFKNKRPQAPVYSLVSRLLRGGFPSKVLPLTRGLWSGECFDLNHPGPWWYLEL